MMKKSLFGLFVFCLLFLSATALAQYATIEGGGTYATITEAINAAPPTGATIDLASHTFGENVVVNKSVTINGVGDASIITPSSGVGVTVTANNVTLENFRVKNAGDHGIYAANLSNLTIDQVTAELNGTSANRSGIALQGVTTASIQDVTVQNNARHGLEIGASSGVSISGGTYYSNGAAGDYTTGGGIFIYSDNTKTTNNVTVNGVNASSNKTAGIFLSCAVGGTLSNTTIGGTSAPVLNDNGSSGTLAGGAAVLVYGPCNNTTITANSTKSGLMTRTAGLVILGTNANGDNSPTLTYVMGCTLSGFSSTSPAATMYATDGSTTLRCNMDVDATGTPYNTINGIGTGSISLPADGYTVEDLLYHKTDDLLCGRFKGPGGTVYVTQNSGSINRGIACATGAYLTVQVQGGAAYVENVIVNQSEITVSGDGTSTIIKPSSGTALDVTKSSVTLKNLHIYLSSPFAPSVAPACSTITFTFPVKVKAFLQGPYDEDNPGTMLTTLATEGQIPLGQPYNTSAFGNYDGGETVSSTDVFTTNNIVDWMLIQLSSSDAGPVEVTKAALLNSNGKLVQTDGITEGIVMTTTKATGYDLSYYIVIRHRNHLAIMTPSAVTLPNATAYDFTSNVDNSYGSDMTLLTGGFYGMRSGDGNANGLVQADDRYDVWRSQNGQYGYLQGDYNLNAYPQSDDRYKYWRLNNGKGTQVPF